ncbi:MAG TPA: hypothetical protein VKV33_02110, partial [Streptosporangiaceae bacterium]|nr:hypothetical protein [Streptosporangiaceae bacterium]
MTRLIRTELLKLRTARVGYGLLLIAAATTALFASLEASRNGRSVAPISTASGLSSVTTTTGFAMVIAAVLGVIAASGEFRHGSATLTYLAVPKRARVLVAKAGAAACAGAVIGLTAGIVATGVGLGFAAGHGDPITLGAGTLAGH